MATCRSLPVIYAILIISEPLKDFAPSRLEALLDSNIPFFYYRSNIRTDEWELTCPAMPSVCKDPFFEGSLLETPVEIFSDSPKKGVLYSDTLPVDHPERIECISREELSKKIAADRRHPFSFTTGLYSFIPEYRNPLLSFLPRPEFHYAPGLTEFSKSTIRSTSRKSFSEFLKEQTLLQDHLAICFKGEPLGFGLFNVGETIPAGTCIGLYEGEFTLNTTYDAHHSIINHPFDSIQTSQFLGGYVGIGNHSMTPNAQLIPIYFLSLSATERETYIPVFLACLFSIVDIKTYHEITYDYGDSYGFNSAIMLSDVFGRDHWTRTKIRDPLTGLDLD